MNLKKEEDEVLRQKRGIWMFREDVGSDKNLPKLDIFQLLLHVYMCVCL